MSALLELIKTYRTDLTEDQQFLLSETLGTVMSVPQVAAVYGVTKAAVYAWIAVGELPYLKIAGKKVVTRASVLAMPKKRHGRKRFLTSDEAREIKASVGRTTDLALKYGVSKPLVSMIRKGHRYTDV